MDKDGFLKHWISKKYQDFLEWTIRKKLDLDLLVRTFYFPSKKLFRNKMRSYGPRLSGRLLDIGCGRRKPYKRFLGCEQYIGLEYQYELYPDIIGNAPALPFKNSAFDSILWACFKFLKKLVYPVR